MAATFQDRSVCRWGAPIQRRDAVISRMVILEAGTDGARVARRRISAARAPLPSYPKHLCGAFGRRRGSESSANYMVVIHCRWAGLPCEPQIGPRSAVRSSEVLKQQIGAERLVVRLLDSRGSVAPTRVGLGHSCAPASDFSREERVDAEVIVSVVQAFQGSAEQSGEDARVELVE